MHSVEPQFARANYFFEDLAAVKIGSKWGYINREGKTTVQPQFDSAGSFSEGITKVSIDGKIPYIDNKGQFIY